MNKYYDLVKFEVNFFQGHIQNRVKHLKWSDFLKIVLTTKSKTSFFAKHLRCLTWP